MIAEFFMHLLLGVALALILLVICPIFFYLAGRYWTSGAIASTMEQLEAEEALDDGSGETPGGPMEFDHMEPTKE